MSTTAKPFRRISSLVRRNRQETPYQAWAEDQVDNGRPPREGSSRSVVEFPVLASSPTATDPQDRVLKAAPIQPEQNLIECFYLGSTDMSGLEIKGRGCIDYPAGIIWEQSQQETKPKRKNSWPTRQQYVSNSFKPRYVKLVTSADALQVHDNSTGELITQFNYKKISFVGTHPKYTRLFAFIAESSNSPPFCHAFKCEDKGCAKQAACSLSDLFHKKIQELLQIQVTAQATVLP